MHQYCLEVEFVKLDFQPKLEFAKLDFQKQSNYLMRAINYTT